MVIPIHDRNPTRRTPWVTWLLIAVNVVVFLLEPTARVAPVVGQTTVAQFCRQEAFFREYGAIPEELTSNEQLPYTAGRAVTTAQGTGCLRVTPSYDKTPVLSVLFAMFLHGGWLHLFGNMLFLLIFGNNVEDRMGRLRFLVFYLVSGYIATYGFAFANAGSTTTLVGASGAIAGVLGAYFVLYPRARVIALLPFLFFIPFPLPAWLVLGSWFVLQYLYAQGVAVSSAGEVAFLAHVFGFLFGLVVALPLRGGRGGPPTYRRLRSSA